MMTTNEAGLKLIKSFERCRLSAYKCPAGKWTIGYGHTRNVKPGDKITLEQADAYFRSDLKTSEKTVREKCEHLHLNSNEFSALVSFTFNCGSGNLSKLIAKRTKPVIAEKILLYNKAGGKVLAGLVGRRQAERALFIKKEV